MELWSREAIEAALLTEVFGAELLLLARTTSTSDILKKRAAEGAPEGMIVVADEQSAGRGRLDRRWLAPAGTSLLLSILFRPQLVPSHANRLTMLCALAASDALEAVARLPVDLKWPNDLVVQRHPGRGWRKLGGILTESGLSGQRLAFVVVGIGLNVNVPRECLSGLAPDATSVLAETGGKVDRAALLAALLAGVETRYRRLQAGESPHGEWSARLATLGRRVEVISATGPLSGVAEGVDEDGALWVRADDGSRHRLLAGDVSLAPP